MKDFDKSLDTTGLNSPIPILRVKKELIEMVEGEILKVIATCETALVDFEAFCKQNSYSLHSSKDTNGVYTFFISK